MNTKKSAKPAWYGLAAVALGTGIFFLATNKGRLLKKGAAGLKALLGGAATPPLVADPVPVPGGRTPTPANGHVRDVVATDPLKPEPGSTFTKHGEGQGPRE